MTSWYDEFRAGTERHLAAGSIDKRSYATLTAMVDFAEARNLLPTAGEVDLWGFGTVEVLFKEHVGGAWWVSLHSLLDATGLTLNQLQEAYTEEAEMDYGDVGELTIPDEDGEPTTLQLLANTAVMRIFMGRSVWAREFADNMFGLFRRAVVDTGLGDHLGPVQLVDEHGEPTGTRKTFAEWMAEGDRLPDLEEARARAFSGPAGVLRSNR